VPIYIAAPEGDAAVRITAEAERVPGTLIAMATHGRSGIPRMVMGSVTNGVPHAATDPIPIVRASSEEDFTGEVDLKPSSYRWMVFPWQSRSCPTRLT